MRGFRQRIALGVVSLAALVTIRCVKPVPPPVTPVDADGSAPSCASVCANGRRLGCTFSQATPKGATCETVCANDQPIAAWDLGCRTSATSCAAIDACK